MVVSLLVGEKRVQRATPPGATMATSTSAAPTPKFAPRNCTASPEVVLLRIADAGLPNGKKRSEPVRIVGAANEKLSLPSGDRTPLTATVKYSCCPTPRGTVQ